MSQNRISIEVTLLEHGWANAAVSLGSQRVDLEEFGYCVDSIGDLARAALAIAAGAFNIVVNFDGEPYG